MAGSKIHPLNLYIGMRIKRCRVMHQITPDELGKVLDVSAEQVKNYERGSKGLSISRLYDISRIMDTPIEWFCDGYSDEKPIIDYSEYGQDHPTYEEINEMIELFCRINCRNRRSLMMGILQLEGDSQSK